MARTLFCAISCQASLHLPHLELPRGNKLPGHVTVTVLDVVLFVFSFLPPNIDRVLNDEWLGVPLGIHFRYFV